MKWDSTDFFVELMLSRAVVDVRHTFTKVNKDDGTLFLKVNKEVDRNRFRSKFFWGGVLDRVQLCRFRHVSMTILSYQNFQIHE